MPTCFDPASPMRRACAVATGLLLAASARAQTVEERCLLDALRQAPPQVTAEEIRAECRDARRLAPARIAPPAEALAPAPAAAEPTADPTVGIVRDTPQGISVAPVARSVPVGDSPVRRRIDDEGVLWGERFALLPHRPNYLLPFTHAFVQPGDAGDRPVQRNEVKFQISFKFPLTPPLYDGRAALFFGYTGQSWWQAYNDERSTPFREYSHEPELFAAWAPGLHLLGWDWRVATVGLVHQSNGRSGEFSRSWNRVFAEAVLDRPGPWWLSLRPWWRIPERDKPAPDAPEGDDNPLITRYAGHGEVRLGYAGTLHNWTLMMRRGLSSGGKGAVQLDYSRPTGISPRLRWYLQYFDGYGESLLDYQTRIRRIGFGVMLNDWF
ncbi:MAG: phospholipase [Burkholderiales bacterium]|nr:MAG: phospholipase [Burkholderiales bacterium]